MRPRSTLLQGPPRVTSNTRRTLCFQFYHFVPNFFSCVVQIYLPTLVIRSLSWESNLCARVICHVRCVSRRRAPDYRGVCGYRFDDSVSAATYTGFTLCRRRGQLSCARYLLSALGSRITVVRPYIRLHGALQKSCSSSNRIIRKYLHNHCTFQQSTGRVATIIITTTKKKARRRLL